MHRLTKTLVAAGSGLSLLLLAACGENPSTSEADVTATTVEAVTEVAGLKTPAAFVSISDEEARAAALFGEMSKVILHPRCANCHPRTDGPMQGDAMEPHNPPVERGAGVGVVGMECGTCHGAENVEFASMEGSMPGAQPWLLAPASMGWSGASIGEVCNQIKDKQRNGGRGLGALVEHMARDHLVNWAWNPGEGRSPAPGDQKTMGALAEAWVEAGAHCPES